MNHQLIRKRPSSSHNTIATEARFARTNTVTTAQFSSSRMLTVTCYVVLLFLSPSTSLAFAIPSLSVTAPWRLYTRNHVSPQQQQQQQQQHQLSQSLTTAGNIPVGSSFSLALLGIEPRQTRKWGTLPSLTDPSTWRAARSEGQTSSLSSSHSTATPPSSSCSESTPPILSSAATHVSPSIQAAQAWARKYASVDALRQTFGGNKNHVWGDLDAASARQLYKTLLPRALLELHQYYSHQLALQQQQQQQQQQLPLHRDEDYCDQDQQEDHEGSQASDHHQELQHHQDDSTTLTLETIATDLAPLAYQARVAAKLYARERSRLPARLAANLYDGFRSMRKYGKWQMQGMSYQQVWEKYAEVIGSQAHSQEDEHVVAAKIGLKILERACASNPFVDSVFLKETTRPSTPPRAGRRSRTKPQLPHKQQPQSQPHRKQQSLSNLELQKITQQLEEDVRHLLWPAVLDEDTLSVCSSAQNMTRCALSHHYQQQRQQQEHPQHVVERPLYHSMMEDPSTVSRCGWDALLSEKGTDGAVSSSAITSHPSETVSSQIQMIARYRKLRQLARMKAGLGRLSLPFHSSMTETTVMSGAPTVSEPSRTIQTPSSSSASPTKKKSTPRRANSSLPSRSRQWVNRSSSSITPPRT